MPFIKEEDLVKLYKEIDNLSEKKEDLQKGFIDLKLKNNKVFRARKYRNAIICVLFMCAASLAYLFQQSTKEAIILKQKQELVLQTKLDSIELLSSRIEENNINKIIYTVQVGMYRYLKIEPSLSKNFKSVENKNGTYTYLIGEFFELDQAEVFQQQIVSLGIKDAFIVAYYDGEVINIEEVKKKNFKLSVK